MTLLERLPQPRVTAIELQNFQSIEDHQIIPIGRLTFLYGPNSSGKSAIKDALNTLSSFISNKEIYKNTNSIYEDHEGSSLVIKNLSSQFRREKNNRLIREEAILGVHLDIPKEYFMKYLDGFYNVHEIPPRFNEYADLDSYVADRDLIRLGFKIKVLPTRMLLQPDAELQIDGLGLIGIGKKINIEHPILDKKSIIESWLSGNILNTIENQKLANKIFSIDSGWLDYKLWTYVDNNHCIDTIAACYEHLDDLKDDLSDAEVNQIYSAFDEFVEFHNILVSPLMHLLGNALKVHQVEGSRNIPTREEMTFLLSHDGEQDASWPDHYHLKTNVNPIYSVLAGDCVRALQLEKIKALEIDAYTNSDGTLTGSPSISRLENNVTNSVLNRVNATLRDHLLLDRSYQITGMVDELLPASKIRYSSLKNVFDALRFSSTICRLRLQDAQGNTFYFDEVGSGIGYVMPILVKMHQEKGLLFVEQPELHLHPALQGALMDAIIEVVSDDRVIVIESHSENLLLRALRRIRETSNNKSVDARLALESSDVCVLYFEPTAQGSTKIRRLRIASNGEFLDRWPGGFFCERDQDLFDVE
jgi:predicted ATPase